MSAPYRFIREPFASYRVECGGKVIGWVNRDILGNGWHAHRKEAGEFGGAHTATLLDAAEWLLQEAGQ